MDTTASAWLPSQASSVAPEVDALFSFLLYVSLFFFLLIVGLIVFFIIKYRRRSEDEIPEDAPTHNTPLEVAWIIVPLILVIIMFVWGFKGFLKMSVVPAEAMEIKVTGQKWFWSFEYPDGTTTTNDLVVPVDRPIKLLMSSRDVIHSFFVPAFRVKRDVLPNRYTVTWFEATREGDHRVYCAEYCGSKHSQMLGTVKALPFSEYEKWHEEASNIGEGLTPAEFGALLYEKKSCYTCHTIDGSPSNGPSFLGIFGHEVKMADGSTIVVDENYIRESILNPMSKVVGGFQPVMPTYQGLIKDKELDALVAYIKSLKAD